MDANNQGGDDDGDADDKNEPANDENPRSVTESHALSKDGQRAANDDQLESDPATEDSLDVDMAHEGGRVVYSTMQGVELVEQPTILKAELHEHQIEGISWMVHMFERGVPMILGDQMGLGKTIQSIGFIAYLYSRLHKKGPYLIVVPLSVLSNWLAEIERFCPSFRAVRFHGE